MTDPFLRFIWMFAFASVGAYFAADQWQWDPITAFAGALYLLALTSPLRH